MLNVLPSQKDKTQRQIISFINGLFISLLSLLCSLSTNFKTLQLPFDTLGARGFFFRSEAAIESHNQDPGEKKNPLDAAVTNLTSMRF